MPLTIISPWTRGRSVYSETLDHTSALKLLEARFPAIKAENISPWRYTVVGDMVHAFNFDAPDYSWPTLPDTSDYVALANEECVYLPDPIVPAQQTGAYIYIHSNTIVFITLRLCVFSLFLSLSLRIY